MIAFMSRAKWSLILIALLLISFSFSYLKSRSEKSRSSNIVVYGQSGGFGVYSDPQCTVAETSIDWGNCSLGATYNTILYAFNDQDSNVTVSMNTSDWSPSLAADYLSESWNWSDEMTLLPNSVQPLTLTLNVSQDAADVTDFSFNTVLLLSGGSVSGGQNTGPSGNNNTGIPNAPPTGNQVITQAVQTPIFWVVVVVVVAAFGVLGSSSGSKQRRRRGATEGRERSGRGATEY
jgi:hypothetical protein